MDQTQYQVNDNANINYPNYPISPNMQNPQIPQNIKRTLRSKKYRKR